MYFQECPTLDSLCSPYYRFIEGPKKCERKEGEKKGRKNGLSRVVMAKIGRGVKKVGAR